MILFKLSYWFHYGVDEKDTDITDIWARSLEEAKQILKDIEPTAYDINKIN